MDSKQIEETQEQALLYMELSKFAYEIEEKREESFILQAGRMQSAFSFAIAAIAMLINPVFNENNGNLPFGELYAMFASIIGLVVLSLLFATIAQRWRKRIMLIDPQELEKQISSNWRSDLDAKSIRFKSIGQLMLKMIPNYRSNNSQITKWLSLSRICFYLALFVSAFWFIVITVQLF